MLWLIYVALKKHIMRLSQKQNTSICFLSWELFMIATIQHWLWWRNGHHLNHSAGHYILVCAVIQDGANLMAHIYVQHKYDAQFCHSRQTFMTHFMSALIRLGKSVCFELIDCWRKYSPAIIFYKRQNNFESNFCGRQRQISFIFGMPSVLFRFAYLILT